MRPANGFLRGHADGGCFRWKLANNGGQRRGGALYNWRTRSGGVDRRGELGNLGCQSVLRSMGVIALWNAASRRKSPE